MLTEYGGLSSEKDISQGPHGTGRLNTGGVISGSVASIVPGDSDLVMLFFEPAVMEVRCRREYERGQTHQ